MICLLNCCTTHLEPSHLQEEIRMPAINSDKLLLPSEMTNRRARYWVCRILNGK